MKELEVTIITEDFVKASQFNSPEECPLSNALNRLYGDMGIWRTGIWTASVYEDGKRSGRWIIPYIKPPYWGNIEKGVYSPTHINLKITTAKTGVKIGEVKLVLEEDTSFKIM